MANSSAEMREKAQRHAKKFEKTKNMGYDRHGFDAMEKCAVSEPKYTKKKRK